MTCGKVFFLISLQVDGHRSCVNEVGSAQIVKDEPQAQRQQRSDILVSDVTNRSVAFEVERKDPSRCTCERASERRVWVG